MKITRQQAEARLKYWREYLATQDKATTRNELVADMMRHDPIIRAADLGNLCYLLAYPPAGYASDNDLKGVLGLLEKSLDNPEYFAQGEDDANSG